MARIRSLKPGFFSNEELCELSPWHRLCFAGLWTQADREGRLEDRPRRLKGAIFPYDDLNMDQLIQGLADKGFLTRYAADGVAYLAICAFLKHQRPKSDETPSVIPAPLSTDPRGNVTAPRPYNGQRDLGSGNRTEGLRADGAPLVADGVTTHETADGADHQRRADDFMNLWNSTTTPPIPRCRELTAKRRRHIRVRLEEHPLTEWGPIFMRIQASAFCRGENDRKWAASFDWVIGSPDVAVKVLEGKYDDRRKAPAPTEPSEWEHWRDGGGCHHTPRCSHFAACRIVSLRETKGS